MMRHWDRENKYADNVLKEYLHWSLELADKQHTLGSCIIFAKRQCEKISELTSEELLELKAVMGEIEDALSSHQLFRPDRFNYLQLGNVLHHLHFHCIPRYAKPRLLDGRRWIDQSFGGAPTISKVSTEKRTMKKIKDELLPRLHH